MLWKLIRVGNITGRMSQMERRKKGHDTNDEMRTTLISQEPDTTDEEQVNFRESQNVAAWENEESEA